MSFSNFVNGFLQNIEKTQNKLGFFQLFDKLSNNKK